MLIDRCTDRPTSYVGDELVLNVFLMPILLTRILLQLLISSCMHDASYLLEATPGTGVLNTIMYFERLILAKVWHVLMSRRII